MVNLGLKCNISLITEKAVPALFGCLFQQEGGSSYLSVLSNTALGVQTLCKILSVEEVSKDCTPVTACVWENTGQGKKKIQNSNLKLALLYPQAYHTIENTFTLEYTTWQLGSNCKLHVFYCHRNQ